MANFYNRSILEILKKTLDKFRLQIAEELCKLECKEKELKKRK